ncbi:tryptophan--tRNA ligase [Rossellomorea marisflavi]|uniref:tryptophan--tRNA ligase n=1 Tax=Rossellomorea marisflavi TaxID=189381 RepID=UPI003459DAA2
MKQRVLTGIKPTGRIHLGNYVGAIKPALKLAESEEYQASYFIADYHGMTRVQDAEEMRNLTRGIAAAWLALGLDPEKVTFYRQSDVPEIFELTWILSCVTPKGLMNRAHAYKAMTDGNKGAGQEVDHGVNMGVYTYPVLMASDILLFQADKVPVGKDQLQHIEIARDIAGYFNKQYGGTFKLPEHFIQEQSAVVPGLDGRKMSKSYNNTIPLFEEPAKLKKLINKIKTDSSLPTDPKDHDQSVIFALYREFSSQEEVIVMKDRFRDGISWGEAKAELFQAINGKMTGPRERYMELMGSPEKMEAILARGAQRARETTTPFLTEIKKKIGIL